MATIERFTRTEVLFHDAEGMESGDFNAMQRLLQRHLWDDAFQDFIFGGAAPFGTFARPFRGALAVEPAPSGLAVRTRPGTLFWRQEDDPGSPDPRGLVARLGEEEFELNAADSTNDRIDIISVRVDYDDEDPNHPEDGVQRDFEDAVTRVKTSQIHDKRRRVRVTLEYTPGTPVADPDPPSVPVGHNKLAEIRVAANATEIEASDIADFRYPAGSSVIHAPIASATVINNAFVSSAHGHLQAGTGGGSAAATVAIPQVASHSEATFALSRHHLRVRGATAWGKLSGSGSLELRRARADTENSGALVHSFGLGSSFGLATFAPSAPLWMHNMLASPMITPSSNVWLAFDAEDSSGDKVSAAIIECFGF